MVQDPVKIVSDYIDTFTWVYVLLFLVGGVFFGATLVSRVPAKYSRMRPADELLQKRYTPNQIFVDRFRVTGMVFFDWESVAQVHKRAEREIVVEYHQPERWWRRLKEYVGVRLRFKTITDRDRFYESAVTHLANLEENLAQREEQREAKVTEQQRIHDIMYGRSTPDPKSYE